MRIYKTILLILIITGTCEVSLGFTARVASIPDGDTIEVYKQGERLRTTIDLYGIDCPERNQYFGRAARNATAALVASKAIWIEKISEDQAGRLKAVIRVNGKNVNEMLVSRGWAWVIPDDCNQSFCGSWRKLQEDASRRRIGLWAAAKPQPPWEWRMREKKDLFYMLPDGDTPIWQYSP
jgi:endonuclease YncB( thermonuclease family)